MFPACIHDTTTLHPGILVAIARQCVACGAPKGYDKPIQSYQILCHGESDDCKWKRNDPGLHRPAAEARCVMQRTHAEIAQLYICMRSLPVGSHSQTAHGMSFSQRNVAWCSKLQRTYTPLSCFKEPFAPTHDITAPCPKKSATKFLPLYNFAKYWPIFKLIHRQTLQ